MNIGSTYGPENDLLVNQANTNNKTAAEAQESFKQSLNEAITNVNDRQIESNEMTSKLASGEVDNLHEVMVAAEKASVTLQTTVEVRNKALESYKQIMRMQV
ncbi:flagellar hook-basal body complex protein FliE [Salibacterium salarium]|uniref:Flagellar hook-basal body complex protein FliE n=1 Tax=Salibacterium salarium TaxID=284579 RepID=A0A428N327_9BACI|nr:flagellar hook-basal body complex protein FliE [Salibacterium salarium]RSL32860.1 flagellar hook-basal body complex protein FliE [Salibacterium salarium]